MPAKAKTSSKTTKKTVKKAVKKSTKIKAKSIDKAIDELEEDLEDDMAEPVPCCKSRHVYIWRWVISILVVLAILIGIELVGIYKLGWQGVVTQITARTLYLSAGSVDGVKVSLADYLTEVSILEKATLQNREGVRAVDINGAKQDLFDRLVSKIVIQEQLKYYEYEMPFDAVESQVQMIISQFGSKIRAEQTIKDMYGLSLEQFADKVIEPLFMRSILQGLIVKDYNLSINKKALKEAQEVLNLASDSAVDFSLLAEQYTDDETGVNTGGDLGWVSRGELEVSLDEAIFSADLGSVYGEVIANDVGYHIIKVEDRLVDNETGRESAKVRHILIEVDVDEHIRELMDRVVIKKYIR